MKTDAATVKTKARISDTLNFCTETDCAGERKSCLAAHEVDITLVIGDCD